MIRVLQLSAALLVVGAIRPCFGQESPDAADAGTAADAGIAATAPDAGTAADAGIAIDAGSAPDAESASACVRAYEGAQLARRAERLLDARRDLRLCGGEACPGAVQRDCVDWLAQTEAGIPTIVLEAKTDAGPVFDVTASLDGKPVAAALDGRPIEVDPGLHRVTFEHGGRTLDQRIILREGEKNRPVVADWTTPSRTFGRIGETLSVRVERPVPVGVYVSAGVALLGFADFAIAAALGDSLKNQLAASECAPFCPRAETDALRTRYWVADVGLGVGLAELATGVFLFVTRPERTVVTRAARDVSPGPGFRLEPASSGVTALVRGAF